MYFRVYHKKSKDFLGSFNERAVVDFYIKNKEIIENYYFSEGDSKELLEWEIFAVKYSELFEEKANKREEEEFGEMEDEGEIEIKIEIEQKRKRLFLIVLLILLVASLGAYYLYIKQNKDFEKNENVVLTDTVEEKIEKREAVESDTKFTAKIPAETELQKAWKSSEVKIGASLDLEEIKEQMDSYLSDLQDCFNTRVKAGDSGLKGEIKIKIRVSGDGVVRDAIFEDEKYQATLFGDCVVSFLKSKPFKMFKSREQTFSYYWNIK
ncbi:MAG: hypothetical protein ACOX2F_09640 [bacterium]